MATSTRAMDNPQLDQTSPYFVHPSDGPSSISISPKLNGSNYHSWAKSMRRELVGKMKLEFVDGTIDPVVEDFEPSFRAWNMCNMLVLFGFNWDFFFGFNWSFHQTVRVRKQKTDMHEFKTSSYHEFVRTGRTNMTELEI
jgi:hypothetical protein